MLAPLLQPAYHSHRAFLYHSKQVVNTDTIGRHKLTLFC